MTDNEIIRALKKHSMDLCSNCKVEKTTLCNNCISEIERNALDLINRLQAKNKELDEKLVIYKGTIDSQAKRLDGQKHTLFEQQAYSAELQAEIARLKKSNRNWRRKVQRLRVEKERLMEEIYEKGLL